jgi:hypothetical protein
MSQRHRNIHILLAHLGARTITPGPAASAVAVDERCMEEVAACEAMCQENAARSRSRASRAQRRSPEEPRARETGRSKRR